ncbi:hypothetical protein ZIOFF_076186 [Zingiber officinale]|uniref:TOD1/MUCI70 glycosyltransferase-like domain-containing protein n=2 Tax=Zingiber officinale TaxID=94328 RepID=A0A8J5BRX8_ZINOF|nr:hypothetical protein ZIOFF_076186 [Zingiber officinale]
MESVDNIVEPETYMNFTQFSLQYIAKEDTSYGKDVFEARFGGHQTLEQREESFYAKNQTIHCGFIEVPEGHPSTGFELSDKDKEHMTGCRVVVSSCIFGNSDFLRRPTSSKISTFSKKNVCFMMFLDELTLKKLSSEGHIPDAMGNIGLWRIIVVKHLPYADLRKTGKVPKFLSHRLFPSARYSIWLDSKMRLHTDPMLILEYFLWRTRSEYAISNHYDRHCVWEEVLQNKLLNKYNHTVIDEQFMFYQSDGLSVNHVAFPIAVVPEGSFIVRAHTPMSNLFSCLWFNEVDRFTSRDQLSFAYTFLKLKRMNPGKPLHLNMFKDCERRAVCKLFHHRVEDINPPPPTPQALSQIPRRRRRRRAMARRGRDDATDEFDDYDPTPYGGGYDLAITFGRALPASEETCYPISSSSGVDYDRPHYSSGSVSSDYVGGDYETPEYGYSKPKPKPQPNLKPQQEVEEGESGGYGGFGGRRPQPNPGYEYSGKQEYGSGYGGGRPNREEESEYGSGYGGGRPKREEESEHGSGYGGGRPKRDEYGYDQPKPYGEEGAGQGYGYESGNKYQGGGRQSHQGEEHSYSSNPSYQRPSYGGEEEIGRYNKPSRYDQGEEYGRPSYGNSGYDPDQGEGFARPSYGGNAYGEEKKHRHHQHRYTDDE